MSKALPAKRDALPTIVTVAVPVSKAELDALLERARLDTAGLDAVTVETEAEYEVVDEMLSELARNSAALVKIRQAGTRPVYQEIKRVEAWFRDGVAAYDSAIAYLKAQLGAFRVKRAEVEREARALASAAVVAGDSETLVEALTVASEAATKPEGRASVALRWAVDKVCNEGLVPDEYWCVDVAKLEALALSTKGDDPPVVPGVLFKQVARVGARK